MRRRPSPDAVARLAALAVPPPRPPSDAPPPPEPPAPRRAAAPGPAALPRDPALARGGAPGHAAARKVPAPAAEAGIRVVHRPARVWPEPLPTGSVALLRPPTAPDPTGGGWWQAALPALGSTGLAGYGLLHHERALAALAGCAALASVLGGLLVRRSRSRADLRAFARHRDRYLAHLATADTALAEAAAVQRARAAVLLPDPADALSLTAAPDRLWERRPDDPDAGALRLGRGRAPLAVSVTFDRPDPLTPADPDLLAQAEGVLADRTVVDDVPLGVDLRRLGTLVLAGPPATTVPLLRALLIGLAVAQAPGDLRIVGFAPGGTESWTSDLPHTPPGGLVGDAALLLDQLRIPTGAHWTIVVLDGYRPGQGGFAEPAVARLLAGPPDVAASVLVRVDDARNGPSDAGAVAAVDGDGGLLFREAGAAGAGWSVARPDALSRSQAAAVAAVLAPLRLGGHADALTDREPPDLPTLLDALGPAPLRTALGVDADGRPLALDVREPALGGSGPHGLVVGATGAGKSELMRTVLVGLARSHTPAELALVLVDFKGGAAFADLARLPHVGGLVTNLVDDDPGAVDRLAAALAGEVERRQRLLRDAGADDAGAYRATGHELPALVVAVDEFAEMLAARPDLADLFASLGRLGRSLGIHLLLASQRVDEGRLRGLESHLRYRICLRTFTAADSRAALGSDAAFLLPPEPGHGVLAVDGRQTRFRAGRAGGGPGALAALVDGIVAGTTVPAVRPVWLPPLPAALPLDPLLDPSRPSLHLPVGLVDLPHRQRQEPLVLDLAGGGGNLAVAGAPRSGISTLLRTVVAALAAAHGPRQVQVYAVDAGGGGLLGLADLPQVGGVALVADTERAQATVAHVTAVLDERAARTALPAEPDPAVVLVLDNWGRLAATVDDLEAPVTRIATEGLRHGVHLVLGTSRWADVRPALKDACGSRLELRLHDPLASDVGRGPAGEPRADRQGRGLTRSGELFQTALPRIDGGTSTDDLPAALADLVQTVRTRHAEEPEAPPVRLLPRVVPLPAVTGDRLLLGYAGPRCTPVELDLWGDDPVLLVLGDAGSGRTNLLRSVAAQLASTGADVYLVDPRRTSADLAPSVHRYGWHQPATEDLAAELEDLLRARRGGGPHRGRRQVLLLDDYDVTAGPGSAPLAPLAASLPLAREVGLSVVLARRIDGLGRASFEPFLQRITELGPPALILSGDPAQGPLHGIRPRPLPPGRGLLARRGRTPLLVQTPLADRPP